MSCEALCRSFSTTEYLRPRRLVGSVVSANIWQFGGFLGCMATESKMNQRGVQAPSLHGRLRWAGRLQVVLRTSKPQSATAWIPHSHWMAIERRDESLQSLLCRALSRPNSLTSAAEMKFVTPATSMHSTTSMPHKMWGGSMLLLCLMVRAEAHLTTATFSARTGTSESTKEKKVRVRQS